MTSADQVVEVLFGSCLFEGEDSLHNDEQDDCEGEHIDLGTVVLSSFLDLRSHVGHGTSVRFEFIDLFVSSKSKISYFEDELVVNEDVFKLEISVDYVFALHVFKDINHLVEEESSSIFTHSAASLTEIKKKASWNIF